MKTVHKIALARILYRAISIPRRAFGYSDRIVAVRRGLRYELDLREGIDLAIYLFGAFEPSTYRALAKHVRPGMTVLDIGANIGSHTLHLARLVGAAGHVYAFEPTAFAYEKLQHNLALNPELESRVKAFQCSLTRDDNSGLPQDVFSSWPLVAGPAVHPKHLGQQKSTSGARAKTLDSIMIENGDPAVHLIKMDVDGFECDVVAGAGAILSRHKPAIIMELSPYVLEEKGHSAEELISLLGSYGYQFYDERTEKDLRTDKASILSLVADGASVNVIARVPQ